MPCSSDYGEPGYSSSYERQRLSRELKERDAMLCAALTALDKLKIRDPINYEEAGVSKARFEEWWRDHKIKDERRRDRERALREAQRLKAVALGKLTAAERKVLGL